MNGGPARSPEPMDEAGSTERLLIEPLDVRHAPELLAALDDERVGRFIGGPDVTTLDALIERIEHLRAGPLDTEQRWINHAVTFDGSVVGRIEATVHDGIAEVAYVFGPRWWGRGLATEAFTWLVDGLAAEGVDEAWAAVTPGNDAYVGMLLRTGFSEVGNGPSAGLLSYDDGDRVFSRRT
ncbi:MAG: GNAT family N-acetyltransferase [Actinomycetota bacterium]